MLHSSAPERAHIRTRLITGVLISLLFLSSGCSSQKTLADTRVYRMGESAEAGSLIYTVSETEWLDQLGEAPTAQFPKHRFLVIRLSITNSGARELNAPPLSLLDAAGQTYPESTEAGAVEDWFGLLRVLKPAETEHGRIVFDVPTGPYRLQVSDQSDLEQPKLAIVEIPFRLAPNPTKYVLPQPDIPGAR